MNNSPESLTPLSISLGKETGYVFHAESSAAFCFVPVSCVELAPDGTARIDPIGYVISGWSVRNGRCADVEVAGRHLFPDAARPVREILLPGLQEVIARWSRLAGG